MENSSGLLESGNIKAQYEIDYLCDDLRHSARRTYFVTKNIRAVQRYTNFFTDFLLVPYLYQKFLYRSSAKCPRLSIVLHKILRCAFLRSGFTCFYPHCLPRSVLFYY